MNHIKLMSKKLTIKNKLAAISNNFEFQAVDSEKGLEVTKLSSLTKKPKIISSFLSLDTKTCELQTTKFYHYASKELKNFIIISISKDLPFAQKRFCSKLKPEKNFLTWSDYRNDDNNFANSTGLLIEEIQLIARTVIVLDEHNKIVYQEIVEEASQEPDYQKLLNFIKTMNI